MSPGSACGKLSSRYRAERTTLESERSTKSGIAVENVTGIIVTVAKLVHIRCNMSQSL